MPPESGARHLLRRIAREEAALAARAARGERAAFDALFDRYCARMAYAFRTLPTPEAQAKIWEALEQVFAGLACDTTTPLATRAFRVAQASRTGTLPHVVRKRASRKSASVHPR